MICWSIKITLSLKVKFIDILRVSFWAHLCILHGGLICVTFCPSVRPSARLSLDKNVYLRKYYRLLTTLSLKRNAPWSIDFRPDPGSRSSDPDRVTFDHENFEQVAKNPIQKCQMVLSISWKLQGYVMFWNS